MTLASAIILSVGESADAADLEDMFVSACVETFPDVRAANAILKDAGFSQAGRTLSSRDGSISGGAHKMTEGNLTFCSLTGPVDNTDAAKDQVLAAMSDRWPDKRITSYPPDNRGRAAHIMEVDGYTLVFGATRNEVLGDDDVLLDLHNLTPIPVPSQ